MIDTAGLLAMSPDLKVVPPMDWMGVMSHTAKGGLEACSTDEFSRIVAQEVSALDRMVAYSVNKDPSLTGDTEYQKILAKKWETMAEQAEVNWAHFTSTIINDLDPRELLATDQTIWLSYVPVDKESKNEILVACTLTEGDDSAEVIEYRKKWQDFVELYDLEGLQAPHRNNPGQIVGKLALSDAEPFCRLDTYDLEPTNFRQTRGVNSPAEFAAFVRVRDAAQAREDRFQEARFAVADGGGYNQLLHDMRVDYLVTRSPDVCIKLHTIDPDGRLTLREEHQLKKSLDQLIDNPALGANDVAFRKQICDAVARLEGQKITNLAVDAFLFDWVNAVRVDEP